jgi:hypothetical protein
VVQQKLYIKNTVQGDDAWREGELRIMGYVEGKKTIDSSPRAGNPRRESDQLLPREGVVQHPSGAKSR